VAIAHAHTTDRVGSDLPAVLEDLDDVARVQAVATTRVDEDGLHLGQHRPLRLRGALGALTTFAATFAAALAATLTPTLTAHEERRFVVRLLRRRPLGE